MGEQNTPQWLEELIGELSLSNEVHKSFDYANGENQFNQYVRGKIDELTVTLQFNIENRFSVTVGFDSHAALEISRNFLQRGESNPMDALIGHGIVALSPIGVSADTSKGFLNIPVPQPTDFVIIQAALHTFSHAVAVILGDFREGNDIEK